MSYRLITKAVLTITSANAVTTSREVECRLYPAPKRDAAGTITIDGVATSYKRTGGKGRGTADNRYMYATVKGESAFWAITGAEAEALVGGVATLAAVTATAPEQAPEQAPAPAPAPADAPEQAPEQAPAPAPADAPEQAPAPEAPKAQRRGKKQPA